MSAQTKYRYQVTYRYVSDMGYKCVTTVEVVAGDPKTGTAEALKEFKRTHMEGCKITSRNVRALPYTEDTVVGYWVSPDGKSSRI